MKDMINPQHLIRERDLPSTEEEKQEAFENILRQNEEKEVTVQKEKRKTKKRRKAVSGPGIADGLSQGSDEENAIKT